MPETTLQVVCSRSLVAQRPVFCGGGSVWRRGGIGGRERVPVGAVGGSIELVDILLRICISGA